MSEQTTHAAAVANEPRYGNWRRPRTIGFFGLGTGPTLAAAVLVLLSFFAMMIHLLTGWILLAASVLLMAPLALHVGGRNLYQRALARLTYRRGVRRQQHILHNGPLGPMPAGSHTLPGLLAASQMWEAQDSLGRRFGLIRTHGHYTAVLRCDAEGDQLVDQEQVDEWVAHWGQWLAKLGQIPALVSATVTVETAPDTGERLQREVQRLTSPQAPELAQQVLAEAAHDYPTSSAQVSTRVAVSFHERATPQSKPRDAEDMAADIGARLPGMGHELATTGAGAARPMTASELAECVFAAYNPGEVADLDAARDTELGTGISWDNAGPNGTAVEYRDRYVHGSGTSIVYQMEDAPRGAVLSNVLTEFLAPHEDIVRKRVCLHIRPHSPGEGAEILENDLKHAKSLANRKASASARDTAEVRAAQQATDEEASGAGVVRFSGIATATVLNEATLQQADTTMHNLSATARIRLRRVYGGQNAAFAAGLGIGVQPHTVATLGNLFDQ